MITGFLAQKKEMTSIFTPKGERIAVTILEAKPVNVSCLRTKEKDAYSAIQIKTASGKLKEFKDNGENTPELKAEIKLDAVFADGDKISATGISKGRGFAGVIKRHNFRRQPVTGGQSDRVRAPGSIGAQTPGKVVRGKKMPGHYGNKSITVSNLKVIKIDTEKNLLYLSGSVPGHFNSWVLIQKN